MPTKSDVVRLRHMLDAAEKAIRFTRGKKRQDLDSDEQLSLAVVRLIEIAGEAAAKISADVQSRNPSIPWKDVIGTRNRLIHGYEEVDLDIVWQIVSADLPRLVPDLRETIKKEGGQTQRQLY
jgi:uncharacterized protein with HEPN domain